MPDQSDTGAARQPPPLKSNPTLGPTDAPAAVGPSTGAKPSGGGCNTGSGQPAGQEGGEGAPAATPGSCGKVIQNQNGIRSLPISKNLHNILSNSASSINANFVVTSGGQPTKGTSNNRTGSTRHDNTSGQLGAADGYFTDCTTGAVLRGGNPADRPRLAKGLGTAYQGGATGLGTNYMTSFSVPKDAVHHIGGGTDAIWGGDRELLTAAKQGRTPGANVGGGGSTAGGDPCSNGGNGGGCQPISSAAPAAASSIAKGLGMAPAAALTRGLGAIAQTAMGGMQGALQTAIGAVSQVSGISGLMSSVSGLTNLTSMGTQLLGSIGAGSLPSLTGMIPQAAQALLGGGSLTGMIQNVAGQVIGAGLPQLGGFNQILSGAIGAAATGTNISNALMGSAKQVFGNAIGKDITGLTGMDLSSFISNNPAATDGLEGAEGLDTFIQDTYKQNLSNTLPLVGPTADILSQAVQKTQINGFTTMYKDYQSFVTQGMGNLTDHMAGLGNDLSRLGRVGDMQDLINVGTPHQLARQLIEKGFGVSSGLLLSLQEKGLDATSMYSSNHSEDIYDALFTINDPYILAEIKTVFEISDELEIESAADLIDPAVIFQESFDYNRFNELNEIVMQLAMCSDNAKMLKDLGTLGKLLASLETVEYYPELLEENSPLRPIEFYELEASPYIQSKFNESGPTVADFIGTAAGYIHAETLPAIAELYDQIYDAPEVEDFIINTEILIDLLNGVFTDEILLNIVVPGIGTFTTLEDAVVATVGVINNSLESLKTTLPTSNPNLWLKIQYLETNFHESANYLAHEKEMRRQYGIDIGEPQRVSNFAGNALNTIFKLEENVSTEHLVTINGVAQIQNKDWTYNKTTNSIVFSTAPAVDSLITIVYKVNTTLPTPMPTDAWQLASSLEDYALQTGFGNPADFLRRITTDDMHGQRIQAIMIQSRNRERFSAFGLACPGYNQTVNASGDTDLSFIDVTGLWSSNVDRAGEIWLQNTQEVETINQYFVQRMQINKYEMEADLVLISSNIIRQLLFYNNENLVMSDLMAEIYSTNNNSKIYANNRSDLFISYNQDIPTEGYILGPYREIISEICNNENIKNSVFNIRASQNTLSYLESIGVDLKMLTTIIQRVLIVSVSSYLGVSENSIDAVFGIPSVSKNILRNIANNY